MKLLALALCLLASCATVRYARLLPLTTNERAKFTCDELDNEIADAEKFKAGISGNSPSWDRDYAIKYADDRIASCLAAKREKGCPEPQH